MGDGLNHAGKALRDRVAAFCKAAIADRVFPGCVVGVTDGSGKAEIWTFGALSYEAGSLRVQPGTLYDLASVTKSIPTSSVILRLIDRGQLDLDDRAIDLLPELDHDQHSEILIRHLLTFTAVFDMGRPMASIARDEATDVLTEIFRAPLRDRPGTSYLYTNTPSLLLGLIAERVTGQQLDELAEEWFFQPLGMRHTTFLPRKLVQKEPDLLVAPTALDWRGEVRGEVHDPGAWSLINRGHVPGHAGLFSTVPDLLRFVDMILNEGEWGGHRYFSPEMIERMHRNQTPHLKVKAGLGWEIGRPEAQGTHVSDEAFGKTGFTGTSVLMDPVKGRGMVLLCNRTYPEPQERAEILRVWRGLSDIVFAA